MNNDNQQSYRNTTNSITRNVKRCMNNVNNKFCKKFKLLFRTRTFLKQKQITNYTIIIIIP